MISTKSKFSLRENVRLRLLKDMVSGLKMNFPNVPNFILVLDPMTTRIVSSCIKMIELLEEGVVAIERLELSRKQFPKMHAIYFISPTEESVENILKDFSNPKDPQYGNVHLYFTNHVENDVVDKMSKEKTFIERVLTFKELNLDFLSPESNLFHFDMPDALPNTFSRLGSVDLDQKIASKLATIIPALFDFEKFHLIYNKNTSNNISEKVAKILKERIEKFVTLRKQQDKDNEEAPAPVKIIILDRSYDPLVPLAHDYYYQSLVYDLLEVKADIVEYDTEDNAGKKLKKKAILTDKDELWSKYRHQFIGEAMINVSKEFEEFVANNRTAQSKKADMSNLSLQQMSDIVKQMPMYQEVLGKYTLHMSLIQECVNVFNAQDLKALGELEQTLLTGIGGDGKALTPQKLIGLLTQKLAEGNLSQETKLRLVLIAAVALELSEKERKTLSQSLPEGDRECIYKLSWLGVDPSEASASQGKGNKKNQGISVAAKNKLKNISTDLLRYTSTLETLGESIVSGQLSSSQYGNIYIPSSYDGSIKGKAKAGGGIISSLRAGTKKPNWSDNVDEKVQPKYIFFFIGGMSYAEIRILSELERNNPNMTVIMGSTALMKPAEYIEGIKQLPNPK